MRLTYFQKIVFAGLEVISGILNVFTALIGKNPTWELEAKYWKSKLDNIYNSRIAAAAKERADAQKRYNDERDNLLQSNTD
jgi:regulator of replication initiation timing